MKKLFALFTLSFVLACQSPGTTEASSSPDPEEKVEALKEEVMAAHDRVMPEMNPMGRMQRSLLKEAKTAEDSVPYRQAAAQLKQAQDKMMNWMRGFDIRSRDTLQAEVKIEYLEGELQKMLAIEEFTNKAMAQADSLLKN